MPNPDAVANVAVIVAAGIGTIVAIVCAVRLIRYRGSSDGHGRLTYRQGG